MYFVLCGQRGGGAWPPLPFVYIQVSDILTYYIINEYICFISHLICAYPIMVFK